MGVMRCVRYGRNKLYALWGLYIVSVMDVIRYITNMPIERNAGDGGFGEMGTGGVNEK